MERKWTERDKELNRRMFEQCRRVSEDIARKEREGMAEAIRQARKRRR